MKRLAGTFWMILLVCLPCSPVAHAAGGRIRVLLLDGESGGPYHNWQVTTPILKMELEETGLFDVTVATAPRSDGDFSKFKPDFSLYQVVVSNLDSPDWPTDLKARRSARGRQCVSELACLQRDDGHRRLAKPYRKRRATLVYQGRKGGVGSNTWQRRPPRGTPSIPDCCSHA